jgi:predicted metal-binding membrane protein
LNSTATNFEARMGRLALTGSAISILVALVALAGLGWAYVSAQSGSMTMSVGGDFESFAIFLATWVVMMAAMMFPSVAPVVLVYAQYTRRQAGPWPLLATLFVAGYLMIWSAVGVGAYVLVGLLAPLVAAIPGVQAAPQVFLGAAIGAGGLYQLTPLKEKCLGHCRSPLHWLIGGFRSGASGALRMGIDEGVFCVGCCAGLMLVLLAVGLASVGWMAAVAAVIFIEKVLAPTAAVAKAVAVLLVGFGIAIATIPTVAEFVIGGPQM